MTRVQAIITRGHKLLMAKHRFEGREWWCLPGGSLDSGETPEEAVIRELREECRVDGSVTRRVCTLHQVDGEETITFLVDIGEQKPSLGHDPEFDLDDQPLVDIKWLSLDQMPERDRAFIWASGLLVLDQFFSELEAWGDEISYPENESNDADPSEIDARP